MLIGGLCILALLIGMLGISVFGGNVGSVGCGGDYRGTGANEQLVAALSQYSARYARGFESDEGVAHGELGSSESVTMHEDVTGPACFVWVGLSNPGSDLDLYLRQNGQIVAQDRGEDNYPVVRHCVAESSTIDIEVQMFGGGGDWVVQRHRLAGEDGADLLTPMHQLYTSMFVVNGQPVGGLKRLHLKAGQDAEIFVEMDSQWCYLPLAVSRPGTDIDMYLLDPQGREVERDDAVDNYPVLRHCPAKSGRHRLKLLMFGGESDVVYRVYRGKLGGAGTKQPSRPGQIDIGSAGQGQPSSTPSSQEDAPAESPASNDNESGETPTKAPSDGATPPSSRGSKKS